MTGKRKSAGGALAAQKPNLVKRKPGWKRRKPNWKLQAKRSSAIWKAAKRPRPLGSRRRKFGPNSANAKHARDLSGLVLCLAALVR